MAGMTGSFPPLFTGVLATARGPGGTPPHIPFHVGHAEEFRCGLKLSRAPSGDDGPPRFLPFSPLLLEGRRVSFFRAYVLAHFFPFFFPHRGHGGRLFLLFFIPERRKEVRVLARREILSPPFFFSSPTPERSESPAPFFPPFRSRRYTENCGGSLLFSSRGDGAFPSGLE